MMMCKVLVTGGRNFTDIKHVHEVLETIKIDRGPLMIIQGGATGADFIAKMWAMNDPDCEEITVKANWEKYGKRAGRERNQKMLDDHTPDLVMAFPGGRGTADMTKRASASGFTVCSSKGWLKLSKQIMSSKDYKSFKDWQELEKPVDKD